MSAPADAGAASPRLTHLGDAALILSFGERIAPEIHTRVMDARAALPALPGITGVVPGYSTLTVHFDPLRLPHARVTAALEAAAQAPPRKSALAGRWSVPVCFDAEFGQDLESVAALTGRAPPAIAEALCALELDVYLIGFLPGFPYLGELPEWLRLPRKDTPRTAVPAGSVAIAGAQAAIYPWTSPGGWHLLGRTPLRLFDATHAERPAMFAPGDRLRFRAVGRAEFDQLAAAIEAGELAPDAFRGA